MRVFVAGATGALGRPVVRALVARGDEVVGLTRVAEKRAAIEALGAQPAVADALDAVSLAREVRAARPTHVLHLLTALPAEGPLRLKDLHATNVLRIQATANLLTAATAAGAERLVGESFVGVFGMAAFDRPATEEEPLPRAPEGRWREAVQALRSLEEQLGEARRGQRIDTVALRFGLFYGAEVPSTVALARRLARRQVFVPNGAKGIASFIHIDDAAAAVLAALRSSTPDALYHVADDEPMRLTTYLAWTAQALGLPPPRSAPAWLIRLLAPIPAAAAFARLPLANGKAKRELGWSPRFPTLRQGLREVAVNLSRPAVVSAVRPTSGPRSKET